MMKQTRFADSPLLDAMRDAARAVDEFKRKAPWPATPFAYIMAEDVLVGLTAAPRRAALRTAFPQ